jgi:two-component system CheB/CheR fusion protein
MCMFGDTFRERLLWARHRANLTHGELRDRIENDYKVSIEAKYLAELESGKSNTGLTLEVARTIALALGVSVDYLAGLTDSPSPHQEHQMESHQEEGNSSLCFSSPDAGGSVRLGDEMTEQDRALIAELVRSEAQLQTLFNEAPLGIYLVDVDFRLERVNPTAMPVFRNIPKVIGRNFDEVIHILWPQEQADELVERFRHTLESGEPYRVPEYIMERRDRSVIEYYEWQINRILLPDGRYGVVCYFQDISEQVFARQAIEKSEERYRALFEAIDEGFCTIEVLFDANNYPFDYRFLEMNPAFERQTGLRQAVGKTARELVPNLEAHWFETYGKVALTGQPIRFVNGSKPLNRWFDTYAFRIGLPASHQVAILFTDIRERKQADEAVRTSEQNLRELTASLEARVAERTEQVRALVTQLTMSEQEERRRISQILHDDLQQRLYGIQFQLAELLYALSREDRVDARQTMTDMEASLNDLIHITRSLSVDLSPPILHDEGLTEATSWLAHQMENQYGLAVTIEAEEELPSPDEDLRVLLFQTVRELLFNVVKHAGVTTATVALSHKQGQICVAVRDEGHGFDASAGMQSKQNSQGLLRIRQRLQLVGGQVEIESAPGQGTRVTLCSPICKEKG